jgi:class 3 adenylate cyclase
MQQIAEWLGSLGLSEYGDRFAENGIDISVLRDLTDQDLKEIGVLLGHRRKMMRAIAELAASTPAMPRPAEASEPMPRDDAERRQLTVMFTDLVGSTALSTRLDPEDLRSVIGAYHRCVAETVARFDGFVAKYMGDGVLAYFGYPQAHEDDAEWAVRTGLVLVNAVGGIQAPEPLRVRIGIATGLVVVGDLGTGEAQERGVVGETPNLAARLQAAAGANEVIISADTRRLIGDLFICRRLDPIEAKGFAAPVEAWQVVNPSTTPSRFEAMHGASLSPLVGRDEELELLLRRWRQAQRGDGSVVLLSGEPGIGKSRLTVELQTALETGSYTRLRYFCAPHYKDSALRPIALQLERAAGFEHHDTPETKRRKLSVLLARSATLDEDAVLLCDLLSLPVDGGEALPEVASQRKKEKTLVNRGLRLAGRNGGRLECRTQYAIASERLRASLCRVRAVLWTNNWHWRADQRRPLGAEQHGSLRQPNARLGAI